MDALIDALADGMALASLPWGHEDLEERTALYQECDPNGNGRVSFAEIEAVFHIKFGIGEAEKMMVRQAFDAPKNLGKRNYIEHNEFRGFLEILATNAMLEIQVARMNAACGSAAAIAEAAVQCEAEHEAHLKKKRRLYST